MTDGSSGTAPGESARAAPRAMRNRPPGWRSPRLIVGLALVAGSVLLGARLMASADDTVAVWAAASDQAAGATLGVDDVERRQVRFPDARTADAYLSAEEALPEDATLSRSVSAGELLPRAALAAEEQEDLVEVPVSLAADDLPATVRRGSVVDVWVAPPPSGAGPRAGAATKVLQEVVVVAVPRAAGSLAPQATRQVIVGVPTGRDEEVAKALGRMSEGRVVVARVG